MFEVTKGTVVADKYLIERVLGAGGMGVVVVALHLHLDERVAIKFLLPEVASSAEAVARFTREAKVAAKIKSEHVARVLDVAVLPDGAPYMVMEYLVGSDLGVYLKAHGALPGQEVASFALQTCEALAEAHALGIVHRDLKPVNLFLAQRSDGTRLVKILDFGISKLSGGPASAQMTRTAAMMGTPYYMSPEQLASARDVDARADIWALGVTLFELLTGELPFKGETLPQICTNILHTEPPKITQLRRDLPRDWGAILERCLAKRLEQRYRDVGELARDLAPLAGADAARSLERIAHFLGTAAPVSLPASAVRSTAAPAATDASWTKSPSPLPKSRTTSIVLSALVLVLLGVGAKFSLSLINNPGPPSATAAGAPPSPASIATSAATVTRPQPAIAPLAASERALAAPASSASVTAPPATSPTTLPTSHAGRAAPSHLNERATPAAERATPAAERATPAAERATPAVEPTTSPTPAATPVPNKPASPVPDGLD
jgi:serine/threonine protein kinase